MHAHTWIAGKPTPPRATSPCRIKRTPPLCRIQCTKSVRLPFPVTDVNGILFTIEYKDIKHIHLSVYPPDGRAHISAPRNTPEINLNP